MGVTHGDGTGSARREREPDGVRPLRLAGVRRADRGVTCRGGADAGARRRQVDVRRRLALPDQRGCRRPEQRRFARRLRPRRVAPARVTGVDDRTDATPPDGVEIDEENDGGSPVWEGDRERSDEHEEDESEAPANGDEESGGVRDDDPVEESERETDDGSDRESTGEANSDEEVLPCGCTVECTCGAHEDASGGESESGTDGESGAADEPENEPDAPADEAENGEREAAEESELVVEWSLGDDE